VKTILKLVLLNPKLTDLIMNKLKSIRRTEPVNVAKFWDDL